jgi:hypothetical protein
VRQGIPTHGFDSISLDMETQNRSIRDARAATVARYSCNLFIIS